MRIDQADTQSPTVSAQQIIGNMNLPSGHTYELRGPWATQPHRLYPPDNFVYRTLGEKHYELTDHLGNVRATVTDRKIAEFEDAGTDWSIVGFSADITSAQDYYPFGWTMPGRKYNPGEYRYSFQGQEADDEIKGVGNSINYKYRMHDPRIGRFFSVDPLAPEYPHNSPYAFSENRVIDGIELEGLEYHRVHGNNGGGKSMLQWSEGLVHSDGSFMPVAVGVSENTPEYFKNRNLDPAQIATGAQQIPGMQRQPGGNPIGKWTPKTIMGGAIGVTLDLLDKVVGPLLSAEKNQAAFSFNSAVYAANSAAVLAKAAMEGGLFPDDLNNSKGFVDVANMLLDGSYEPTENEDYDKQVQQTFETIWENRDEIINGEYTPAESLEDGEK